MVNWKGCERKLSWPNLGFYSDICLQGLRNTKQNLSEASLSTGLDLKPKPADYEAGISISTNYWKAAGFVYPS
jgi:hypothetical protein